VADRSPNLRKETWDTYREAFGVFARGATVSAASKIALVVGTWLSLVNHSGAIFDGRPPWLKIALNYATPFVVASLGFLAARRRRNLQRLVGLLDEGPPRAPSSDA
jgi:hypothetical protein